MNNYLKMNKLPHIIIALATFVISISSLQAQEVLTGLTANKQIAREASKQRPMPSRTAVQLPFVDDFSNYTGFPNPALWSDRSAYVNRSFALQPPTMGVATLDALDENGRVYAYADREGFLADALTSQPIRMDYNFTLNRQMRLSDSLYFSFYYQPAGGTMTGLEWERLGNQPEGQDSLILEFGYATGNIIFLGYDYCEYILGENELYVAGDTLQNPFLPGNIYIFETGGFPGDVISLPCDSIMGDEMYWEHIWSTPGQSLDSWLTENPLQYFKQVMIPITDSRWLISNFQFRFRNYASLEDNNIVGWASNVDQWNVDYVRLDANRSQSDIYPNDVAFVMPTTSILKNYQAMPWSQYRDSDLDDAFQNALVNLSNNTKNTSYTYNIVKQGGGQVATYTPNNENALPYWDNGLHNVPAHVSPAFTFNSLPYDTSDSAAFVVTHVFQEVGTSDQRRCNDTCIFLQKFDNYYAYDDGTAEAGYSILSTMTYPASYFAMRFTLAQPDTLRAIRMWFNSVLEDANVDDFSLMVWDADGTLPGTVLYEQPSQYPAHADRFEDFVEYRLDDPVEVSGTFFVGFYQNNATQLNIGFDQNTDSRAFFVYKTADSWRESFLKGTPMIRPVVGKPLPDIVSVNEQVAFEFSLYPNPAETTLHVVAPENERITSYKIFDSYGKMISQQSVNGSLVTINTSRLAPGMYLLQVCDDNHRFSTQKFIKK